MSKRAEVDAILDALRADQEGSHERKMLHLAVIQAQLLADLVDLQIEANKRLESIEISVG